MRDLPPLSALRAFEAAARHLSFKKAAEELAVTPTAISHQVRQLEEWLGQQLFERHVRRVALTREGRELFPSLREGFDLMIRGIDALRTPPSQEVLTLSSTVAFTSKWLVPRVPAFRAACPGLDLRLHASDDAVDLRAGGVDLAIRYGRGVHAGLRSELLLQDRFAPVCSPRTGGTARSSTSSGVGSKRRHRRGAGGSRARARSTRLRVASCASPTSLTPSRRPSRGRASRWSASCSWRRSWPAGRSCNPSDRSWRASRITSSTWTRHATPSGWGPCVSGCSPKPRHSRHG